MITDEFNKKLKSLENNRNLSTNPILKQEYIHLINLVQQTEENYSKLSEFIQKERDSLTGLENNFQIDSLNTDDLDDNLKDIFKKQQEALSILNSRSKETLQSLSKLNNGLLEDVLFRFEFTLKNALQENYNEQILQALLKGFEELLELIPTTEKIIKTFNLLKSFIDISNLKTKKIKSADSLLNEIEFQKNTFEYVNIAFDENIKKYIK